MYMLIKAGKFNIQTTPGRGAAMPSNARMRTDARWITRGDSNRKIPDRMHEAHRPERASAAFRRS